jgi:hypothetical protein
VSAFSAPDRDDAYVRPRLRAYYAYDCLIGRDEIQKFAGAKKNQRVTPCAVAALEHWRI